MSQLLRMTDAQLRRARGLIRALCANCDHGSCLLLDDGDTPCPCPQMLTHSLLCRYFRSAVLPEDRKLHGEVVRPDCQRRCPECGQPFLPRSPNTRYCPTCAAKRTRRHKRAWAAKNRGRP